MSLNNVKSMLVTGANRGIGLELIRQIVNLPSSPQHLFAACRNPEKAEVSKQNIKKKFVFLFRFFF